MATLYRKYRPQNWESIIGQNHIKLTLQKEIETGKLAHAYLFSGPRGVGKTSTARILAKALNCERRPEGQSEPCNECASCREISGGQSIDVLEIDAASHTGVDNVRENIIDTARFVPTKSRYKIFIIDEVHMLSTAAFNALLKTLEEPPAHVFFILATTESGRLPATIVSRCQRFDFKKVAPEKIHKHLDKIAADEGFDVNKKVLDQVVRLSEGCLRDAESLLEQILSLGEKKITVENASLVLPRSDFHRAIAFLELAGAKNIKDAVILLNNSIEEGVDLWHFSEDIIEVLHLLLMVKTGQDLTTAEYNLEEDLNKRLNALAATLPLPRLTKMIGVFLRQRAVLRASPIPQLPLELALVEVASDETTAPTINTVKSASKPEFRPPSPPPPVLPTEPPRATPSINIDKPAILEQTIANTTVIPNPAQRGEESLSPTVIPVRLGGGGIHSPSLITLNEIRAQWPLFIKKVQDYNHSLPFILKMGEPVAMDGRIVKIAFKYTFHRDKLNESRLRALAEKALNDVFAGANLGIEALYVENTVNGTVVEEVFFTETITAPMASPIQNTDAAVENLIKNFGGQVVE